MKTPLSIVLAMASTFAFAQQSGIGAVKADPNPVRAGQEVKITISAEGEAPAFCGMVVHFDDGSESRQVKIDGKEGKFPVTIAKTFAKAGTYSIKAEGRKITSHFPCVGTATAKLVVDADPAAAKPPPLRHVRTATRCRARPARPGTSPARVARAPQLRPNPWHAPPDSNTSPTTRPGRSAAARRRRRRNRCRDARNGGYLALSGASPGALDTTPRKGH